MGPNTESGVILMLEIILASFLFTVCVYGIYVWFFGNILKLGLGKSKWEAALLLVPLAGFVMPIIWGWQAHLELKRREAGGTGLSS